MALRLLCRHLFILITQPLQTSFCAVAMPALRLALLSLMLNRPA